MIFKRSSGVLLHISSLPGKYGIGDFGQAAYDWVDFLKNTGTGLWQVLPLTPTGFGDSPYQGLSAFAGNPLFIDLQDLCEMRLADDSDLEAAPHFPKSRVNFAAVRRWKRILLENAYRRFRRRKHAELATAFEQFKVENSYWLEDYSTFMALREAHQLMSWKDWPPAYRMREPQALLDFEENHFSEIEMQAFFQFLFFRQWLALKSYANGKGVQIVGDIPIFMGYDSADVWAQPHLFMLDEERNPTFVAGVPPDFFSSTGQLWGNPLYDWEAHRQEGYVWWLKRIEESLKSVDILRLDHFRGFAGYYRIPAAAETAENGEWVSAPGIDLFDTILNRLGKLPFIAEDLGVITPDVVALRERYDLPGMRIIQFAFWGDADHEFLPHAYPVNCVAYTGTHDNDTTRSWFMHSSGHEKRFCLSYLGHPAQAQISKEIIRAVWRSAAIFAIAPMQDILNLGGQARMNLPATTAGNWGWRMRPGVLTDELGNWMKELNITYDRAAENAGWKASEHFRGQA